MCSNDIYNLTDVFSFTGYYYILNFIVISLVNVKKKQDRTHFQNTLPLVWWKYLAIDDNCWPLKNKYHLLMYYIRYLYGIWSWYFRTLITSVKRIISIMSVNGSQLYSMGTVLLKHSMLRTKIMQTNATDMYFRCNFIDLCKYFMRRRMH